MPTSAGRLRRLVGASWGVSTEMEAAESVKPASGASVQKSMAAVSRMALESPPLWQCWH
jgi:hypothetical protein